MFYSRPTNGHSAAIPPSIYTGQRLEPYYGAYIGAFIDREVGVDGELHDEDRSTGRLHRDVAEFDQKIGKRHAAFFTYCGYKSGLPDKWFENLKENGAAAQWAIEPDSLEEVQDDAHLHDLARAAAEAGVPVFVRFASEMNGGWTPYHTPPALYKEKFRLVAKVFHETAPNVAMVWCPNEIPQTNIADYYPGDDVVDWVGVNFYSVYFNDGDATKPVNWANPGDKLQYVYQHYAARHPIMICEWAATHHEKADGVDRPDFADRKIEQLYSSLPRRYPRVKAVFWLDMNAIEYANDPRTRKNDYSLLSSPSVASTYKRMVSSPYFLDKVSSSPEVAGSEVVSLTDKAILSGSVPLSAYVKTYDDKPEVVWSVNGKQMETAGDAAGYDFTLNTGTLPNGPAKITATILDSKGRVAGKQSATVTIHNDTSTPDTAVAPTPTNPTTPVAPPVTPPVTPAVPVTPVVTPTPPTPITEPITPVVPPHSAGVENPLGSALTRAQKDGAALSLTVAPDSGKVTIGDRGPGGGIRITANIGNDPAGPSPTLVVLLLRHASDGSGDVTTATTATIAASTIEASIPADPADDSLAAMDALPGSTISIPKARRRVLRPDTPGHYTVRAILLPTRDAARELIQAIMGVGAPTYAYATQFLHTTALPAGSGIVVADQEIEVVAAP